MSEELGYPAAYYNYKDGNRCCTSCMVISKQTPFPHLEGCQIVRAETAEAQLAKARRLLGELVNLVQPNTATRPIIDDTHTFLEE